MVLPNMLYRQYQYQRKLCLIFSFLPGIVYRYRYGTGITAFFMASDLKYLNSNINFGFVVHEHKTGMLIQLFHLQLTMVDVSTHKFFFLSRYRYGIR